MDKLRVGFVGVGRIADMHYLGYKDNPKAELHAICDTNQSLLQRRSAEWGVGKVFSDFRRLIEDPDLDAVEVITPHHLHAEMSIAALEAGKHVSVQKPMAINIAEADAMVEAAERSGKLLRVIENYRFFPPISKAKEMLENGDIGEPISIRLKSLTGNKRYGWEIPDEAQDWRSDTSRMGEGSIIFDHGQHIWSIARYFLGDVERTFALIGRQKVEGFHELPPGSLLDNPTMATWKYRDQNRYGSWEGVFSDDLVIRSNYYPIYAWAEITGSRGILWVNNLIGQQLNRAPLEIYRDGAVTGFSDIPADYGDSFKRGVHDFIDAILEGRSSELTGPEGRDVLRFSLAVLRSGKEGREVSVNEIVD